MAIAERRKKVAQMCELGARTDAHEINEEEEDGG